MSNISASNHQIGLNADAIKNCVLTIDAGGDLRLSRGVATDIKQVLMTALSADGALALGASPDMTDSSKKIASTEWVRSLSTALLANNGWQKLPSGLILQWGIVSSIPVGSSGTFTYPIPFPNKSVGAVATSGSSTPANCVPLGTGPGVSSCVVTNGGSQITTAYVFVIGY